MTTETFWVWGRYPVLEALAARTARRVLVASRRRPAGVLERIESEASLAGVPLSVVEPRQIEAVAPGQNTQGVAAEIDLELPSTMGELLRGLPDDPSRQFLLALDQVQDPHNLGALLRTADAVGADGVVLPRRHSAPLSGVVAKTSAGAVTRVPVLYVTNLVRAIGEARAAGLWAIGLEEGEHPSIFQTDLRIPLLMVVGGEGQGLRRLTRDNLDLLVSLPMLGSVASLNASVAGSIAMYEALRQRLAAAAGTNPAS